MSDNCTSLELSKKLGENGCKLESNLVWLNGIMRIKRQDDLYMEYPAYDLLWDVCVRYGKEFFGEEPIRSEFLRRVKSNRSKITDDYPKTYIKSLAFLEYPRYILCYLQSNKNKQYVEDYIWDKCLFNPKNKGGSHEINR